MNKKKMMVAIATVAVTLICVMAAFLLPRTKTNIPAPAPTYPQVIDADATHTAVKMADEEKGPWAMSITPDGRLILQRQELCIYDDAGRLDYSFKNGHANSLDVSPDGTWLAICGHQRVYTHNLKTREWGPATPEAGWRYGGVSSATWIGNDELLYTEGAGGVTLWSINVGGRSASTHSYDLMCRNNVSHDGTVMLFDGRKYRKDDYQLFLWHISLPKERRGLSKTEVVVSKDDWGVEKPSIIFALRPDGKEAVFHETATRRFRRYDVVADGLSENARWDAKDGQTCLAYSPDGKTLAGMTKTGLMSLWDMTRPSESPSVLDLELSGFHALGNQLKWSRNGSAIAYLAWGQAGVLRTKNK